MAHFTKISQELHRLYCEDFLTDVTVLTDDKPVKLHKVILLIYSIHYRHSPKVNLNSELELSAKGFSHQEVAKFVDFLYGGESDITDDKTNELIKTLKLDLCLDERVRKKTTNTSENVHTMNGLEMKYLRNLAFQIETPNLLHSPRVGCDLGVRTGLVVHRCHRAILATMSAYFEGMFASGMRESNNDVINLQGIDSELFKLVLAFIYTGTVPISVSNAQDLLSTSVYLQIEPLQVLCEEFLLQEMESVNCIDMWLLGKNYNCVTLTTGAWRYILEHFENIQKLKLIRKLDGEEVVNLLNDDNLNVDDEVRALNFAIDWAKSNKGKCPLSDLLKAVRLTLVDPLHLEDILENERIVLESCESKLLISNAITSTCSDEKPRKENVFVVLKRSSYTSGIDVACFSLSRKKWYSLQDCVQCAGGSGYASCSTSDSIYVTGGQSTPTCIYQFSVNKNQWHELTQMANGRSSHGACYVDGHVYVFGGIDYAGHTQNIVPSVEKFHTAEMSWKTVGKLEIPTYDSAYSAVKSRIYIFGGSIGVMSSEMFIKDIQCFDTVTNTCSVLYHNLPFTLSLGVACSHNKNIYITCPNGKMMHYNEDYPPSVINKTKGSTLMGYATVYHDNAVYIMGGYSMVGETDAIHKFDLKTLSEKKFSSSKYQLPIPFKKQTNQLYAAVMHISRKFLVNECVEQPKRKRRGAVS